MNPMYKMVASLSPKEQEKAQKWINKRLRKVSEQRKKRNVPDGKENEK